MVGIYMFLQIFLLAYDTISYETSFNKKKPYEFF